MTQNGGSSVGLFLLTATNSGASNGSVVFFAPASTAGGPGGGFIGGPPGFGNNSSSGYRFYAGTITGVINPNSGGYSGLFNSSSQVSSNVGAVAVVTRYTLSGTMSLSASSVATASNSQQVTGSASAAASTGTVLAYTVSGWQTSANAVANGFGQVSDDK
jgi:hypothetical protein